MITWTQSTPMARTLDRFCFLVSFICAATIRLKCLLSKAMSLTLLTYVPLFDMITFEYSIVDNNKRVRFVLSRSRCKYVLQRVFERVRGFYFYYVTWPKFL